MNPPGWISMHRLVRAARRAARSRSWKEAARLYEQALQAQPGELSLSVQLGHARKESGYFAGAEAAYRLYLDAHPDDADIHLQMGHLFNVQENFVEASKWYERALQLASANAEIAFHALQLRRRIEARNRESPRQAVFTALRRGDAVTACVAARPLLDESYAQTVALIQWTCAEEGLLDREQEFRRLATTAAGSQEVFAAQLQLACLLQLRGDLHGAFGHFIRARSARLALGEDLLKDDTVVVELARCRRLLYPALSPA